MIEIDTKHPPEKYLAVRGYMRTVGGNTYVCEHISGKRSHSGMYLRRHLISTHQYVEKRGKERDALE